MPLFFFWVWCVWCVCVGGRGASWAQHHQGDGLASSLLRLGMGTEQCAVVISSVISLMISLLNLKLWSRWFRVRLRINIDGIVGVSHGLAPVNRGNHRERQRMLAN